jgi:hypothetical protein
LKQEKERIAAKRAKMNMEETGDRNKKKSYCQPQQVAILMKEMMSLCHHQLSEV